MPGHPLQVNIDRCITVTVLFWISSFNQFDNIFKRDLELNNTAWKRFFGALVLRRFTRITESSEGILVAVAVSLIAPNQYRITRARPDSIFGLTQKTLCMCRWVVVDEKTKWRCVEEVRRLLPLVVARVNGLAQ